MREADSSRSGARSSTLRQPDIGRGKDGGAHDALAAHTLSGNSNPKLSGEIAMNFHARRIDSLPSFATTPNVKSVGADPVFAAIAAHRSARAAFDVAQESHPEYKQRDDAEADLWDSLIATTPTTAAGLRAYLAYSNAFPMIDDQPDSLVAMRKAITEALKTLHVADAPTPAVPASAPGDTIKALIAEHDSMVDTVNSEQSKIERDAAYEREMAIECELAEGRPASADGAMAAIGLLRREIEANGVGSSHETRLWTGLLTSIESALLTAWGPAPTNESGMNAASVRHFLLDIEPIAHDVRAYSEATRLLAEDTETSRNTLIKVAHLAEDASERLVDVILGQFRSA